MVSFFRRPMPRFDNYVSYFAVLRHNVYSVLVPT